MQSRYHTHCSHVIHTDAHTYTCIHQHTHTQRDAVSSEVFHTQGHTEPQVHTGTHVYTCAHMHTHAHTCVRVLTHMTLVIASRSSAHTCRLPAAWWEFPEPPSKKAHCEVMKSRAPLLSPQKRREQTRHVTLLQQPKSSGQNDASTIKGSIISGN